MKKQRGEKSTLSQVRSSNKYKPAITILYSGDHEHVPHNYGSLVLKQSPKCAARTRHLPASWMDLAKGLDTVI